MRIVATLALALAAGPLWAESVTLTVGVRADARPMAYRLSGDAGQPSAAEERPIAAAGYGGYIAFICDSALAELAAGGDGIAFAVVPLNAGEVSDALSTGRADIVCGPTTATPDRLKGSTSSAPVFISGLTYALRNDEVVAPACRPTVGVLSGTTAEASGVEAILDAGLWPTEGMALRASLAGDAASVGRGCDAEPIRRFDTHDDLARAFCAGEVKYYVGDYELVAAAISEQSKSGAPCNFTLSNTAFTEERYVILGGAHTADARRNAAVDRFFEILARKIFFQPSVLDAAFDASFPDSKKSQKLELLYWALRGNRK